jgi:hypothetical protein
MCVCLLLLLLQAANAVGYGGGSHQAILDATRTPKGSVDFFVELHIEQGPLLEQVGAVLSYYYIVAIVTVKVT